MKQNLSIAEFEHMLDTRIYAISLQKKGVVQESCDGKELALKYSIAANKIFADYGIDELKAIFRSGRSYIIFKPTGRIACEIGIDGVWNNSSVRRANATLLSRNGYIKSKTLEDLVDTTARKGKTIYSNMTKEEINAKRNKNPRK